MEYQKIINLFNNTPHQPTKFKMMMHVELITLVVKLNLKLQCLVKHDFKSSLCDYSDSYTLVSGTITVEQQAGDKPVNINKEVVFKSCAPFTDCISEHNTNR